MEPESLMDEKSYQDRKNGIRIIADQMARKFFGYEGNDPKGIQLTKEQVYDLILQHKNNETEIQKDLISDKKEKEKIDSIKLNSIPEINSNINTNINTKENNLNTIINTYNTGTNVNTISNNKENNENEIYSNLNTKRKETSLIDETINDNKLSTGREIEVNDDNNNISREMDVSLEKMSSNRNEDFSDDSIDNINILTINIKKVNKYKKRNIYERSVLERERMKNKLEKKRKENITKKQKEYIDHPSMNPYSEEIIESKEYIPINERAAKIHNMKLFQNIVNEQKNKIKKYENEMAEIRKCKLNSKKFDQTDWNKFIKRQKKWNKKVQYKIKAAILIRDNIEEENYYKPKINARSRSIIQGIEEENKNCIDEVYSRLYNDFNEHRERQKFRNQQSLPSFRPKIIKCSSQKVFGFYSKRVNRCGTNPINYLQNKKMNKKSYIFNKSMEQKSKELFIDSCNVFDKYKKNIERNEKINNKYMKFINKSQQTNQQTNNNISKLNCSQLSSGFINNKLLILDNQRLNQKGKSKKNSSAPFLPMSIKNMIEKNCKEEKSHDNTNGMSQQNMDKEKYHFNLSLYNMEESKEKDKNEKYQESEIDSLYVGTERNKSQDNDKSDELYNNTESKLSKSKEELLAKLEKGKKISPKKDNELIESEKSNKNENNFYKLNIRDTTPTPILMKENEILASKDYSDFFDINDFEEDI